MERQGWAQLTVAPAADDAMGVLECARAVCDGASVGWQRGCVREGAAFLEEADATSGVWRDV